MIKFDVPEGFKAVVEEKDGEISISFKEEKDVDKWEPKDGEAVAFGDRGIGVFKRYLGAGHEDYAVLRDGKIYYNRSGWKNENLRPATAEEVSRLIDALHKDGKRWNEEAKRIEDLPRWRAKNNEAYYFVSSTGGVTEERESSAVIDSLRYGKCNYFKTPEAAEKVIAQIRNIFKESKTE